MKKIFIFIVVALLLMSFVFASTSSIKNYSTRISGIFDKEPFEWSKRDACFFMKGCYENPMCYPFGYIKDGQYCSDKLEEWGKISYGFVNQKSYDGDICENNFECQSNLCYGGECISPSEVGLIDYLNKKINELEARINFLEQQLGSKSDNSIEENVSASITGGVVSENSVERKGFFDWLKNLFS